MNIQSAFKQQEERRLADARQSVSSPVKVMSHSSKSSKAETASSTGSPKTHLDMDKLKQTLVKKR